MLTVKLQDIFFKANFFCFVFFHGHIHVTFYASHRLLDKYQK